MPESPTPETPGEPISIVGVACRFPDAADTAEFLELVVTGRRAFRRMPPVRLDAAEYGETGAAGAGLAALPPDLLSSVRAGLIEGWRFDQAAFGVTHAVYRAADPAHWLALETAAHALADGGFPGGRGLIRDRTGVIIGNTLTGEVSRAATMRSRWPYVRRVLRAALAAGEVSPERHADVIEHAAAGFLDPFPEVGDDSLAGGLPSAIADRICGHFGFRGGGHAVDAAHSSSLLAVAAACSALAAGDIDAAIAGGVDISLDPFELAGLAVTGALATDEMRVFDTRPTGFWPGEGCGLMVLMRAGDALAAGVPAYAEIVGWGVSSAGNTALSRPGSASLLLALRRAYQRAGVDPADIGLVEGDGTGTASGDLAELTSLAEIRQDATQPAALGSVKASIGHTKAAAGAAGLIKSTLVIAAGVIPPATGCVRPHPLIAHGDARLRAPGAAEPWPDRDRLAGVSSVGPGGTSVHMILRRARAGLRRRAPGAAQLSQAPAATAAATAVRSASAARPLVYAFSAADRPALARELSRVADVAPWLSDGELYDLACQTGRRDASACPARAALLATSQDHLARLAREGVAVLPGLVPGTLTTFPHAFAGDGTAGRIALLFPGDPGPAARPEKPSVERPASTHDQAPPPAVLAASLHGLGWLGRLGVVARVGVGHGLGEITGLVWAGCLTEADATRLVAERVRLADGPSAQRTMLVSVDADGPAARRMCAGTGLVIAADNGPRCHVLGGPAPLVRDLVRRLAEEGVPARLLAAPHALNTPAMSHLTAPWGAALGQVLFRPPVRRLVSTVTGAELGGHDDIRALLAAQLTSAVQFAGPVRRAAAGSDLLVEAGPGQALARLAEDCCEVPAVSLGTGRVPDAVSAPAAAALFAAGALHCLAPLFDGRHSRAVDIWRDRVFIASPCGGPPPPGTGTGDPLAVLPRPGPTATSHNPGTQPAEPARPAGQAAGTPPARPAAAAAGTQPPGIAMAPEPRAVDVAGVGPWTRCFAEERRGARPPGPREATGPWRVMSSLPQPLAKAAARTFAHDPAAGTVLALAGDPTEPAACATLLAAAREAVAAGRLVVVTPVAGLTGFCATLHAENPALGVTLVRAAADAAGLRAACRYAAATPGRFRELVVDSAGVAREPVMVAASPGADGTFPLGPADVVLVSSMTRPGDLECATALASRGAALAVIAQPGPEDPRLAVCLASLRAAGARVSRKKADLTDPGQVAAAIRSLERGFGPVTAVVHAVAPGPIERCTRLSDTALRSYLKGQRTRFANLLGALAMERLRVLVTFGPAASRYGQQSLGCEALAGGLLAEQASQLAAQAPRCRTLHVDWGPWGDAAPQARPSPARHARAADAPIPTPGITPLSAGDGAQLLLAMLTTQAPPARVSVHGRYGVPAPPPVMGGLPAPAVRGRFVTTLRVHYPGVELVADTRLCLADDPYLGDYRIDGLPVFPASMALEAMAQGASVVAGRPLRHVRDIALDSPVVIPVSPAGGEVVVRVCALLDGDGVQTVLRCSETGFRVDHARAVFRLDAAPGGRAAVTSEVTAGPAPAMDTPRGIVDGTDMYGPVFFQTGRFRRVAFLPELTSSACRALVRGGDDQPWFGAVPGLVDSPPVLGSPGLNDAALQVLQACLPHRRVLPAACRSVTFTGRQVRGALHVSAVRHLTRGGGRSTGTGVWEVTAHDATGQLAAAWDGVELRDVGPLPRRAAWHPALLATSMEARAADLGLDPSLRADISWAHSGLVSDPSGRTALAGGLRGASPQAGPGTWTDLVRGRGPLDGFTLSVQAACPVACRWQAVGGGHDNAPHHTSQARWQEELRPHPSETRATSQARVHTVAACLAGLGLEPGSPLAMAGEWDDGWIVVRADDTTLACTITEISGVPGRIALAVATRSRPAEHGNAAGLGGHSEPVGANRTLRP